MEELTRRTFLTGAAVTGAAAVAAASLGDLSALRRVGSTPASAAGTGPQYFVNYMRPDKGSYDQWVYYNPTITRSNMTVAKNLGFNGIRMFVQANVAGLGWPTPTSSYVSALQDFYRAAQSKGLLLHVTNFGMWGGLWGQIAASSTWITNIIKAFQAVDPTLAQVAIFETANECWSGGDYDVAYTRGFDSGWPAGTPQYTYRWLDNTNDVIPVWVAAMTRKIRALAPGIPVTTSVPSGQNKQTAGHNGLQLYYNASHGQDWQPSHYDYHCYGGGLTSGIETLLQMSQSIVGSAGLHIGEFGFNVDGSTITSTELTDQAEYAQNCRHYCQQLGIPEPQWWMLYDMASGSGQFTSGQSDGLYTVSGSIKPSGKIYKKYPPGVTVPLY